MRDICLEFFPADAAKAADVHLVFTSVGSANRLTGIPHFDSKWEVERLIAKIGVRATILAPVAFMENLYFIKEQLANGIYAAALPRTRALAQIAVADIGAVAVRVLEDAGRDVTPISVLSDGRSGDSPVREAAIYGYRSFGTPVAG